MILYLMLTKLLAVQQTRLLKELRMALTDERQANNFASNTQLSLGTISNL
jgi:hypothetical protein